MRRTGRGIMRGGLGGRPKDPLAEVVPNQTFTYPLQTTNTKLQKQKQHLDNHRKPQLNIV